MNEPVTPTAACRQPQMFILIQEFLTPSKCLGQVANAADVEPEISFEGEQLSVIEVGFLLRVVILRLWVGRESYPERRQKV